MPDSPIHVNGSIYFYSLYSCAWITNEPFAGRDGSFRVAAACSCFECFLSLARPARVMFLRCPVFGGRVDTSNVPSQTACTLRRRVRGPVAWLPIRLGWSSTGPAAGPRLAAARSRPRNDPRLLVRRVSRGRLWGRSHVHGSN